MISQYAPSWTINLFSSTGSKIVPGSACVYTTFSCMECRQKISSWTLLGDILTTIDHAYRRNWRLKKFLEYYRHDEERHIFFKIIFHIHELLTTFQSLDCGVLFSINWMLVLLFPSSFQLLQGSVMMKLCKTGMEEMSAWLALSVWRPIEAVQYNDAAPLVFDQEYPFGKYNFIGFFCLICLW